MSVIANLFSAAMYAFVLQNLIFTGGYGASEAVRMAAKPKQLFPLTAFITFFSTFGSIFCVLLEQIPFVNALSEIQHSLIFLLVICILYVLMLILLKAVFKAKKRTRKASRRGGIQYPCACRTVYKLPRDLRHSRGDRRRYRLRTCLYSCGAYDKFRAAPLGRKQKYSGML